MKIIKVNEVWRYLSLGKEVIGIFYMFDRNKPPIALSLSRLTVSSLVEYLKEENNAIYFVKED